MMNGETEERENQQTWDVCREFEMHAVFSYIVSGRMVGLAVAAGALREAALHCATPIDKE